MTTLDELKRKLFIDVSDSTAIGRLLTVTLVCLEGWS